MKVYDVNKKYKLARKRKTPTFFFSLFLILIIILLVLAIKYNEIFNLAEKDIRTLLLALYGSIVFIVIILFLTILVLLRPSNILEYDLKNIYHNVSVKKIIIIPVVDIKRITTRIKSGKKAKKPYGTIIIRANGRYKIKNVKDIEEVKKEIYSLIKNYQVYLAGIKAGQELAA